MLDRTRIRPASCDLGIRSRRKRLAPLLLLALCLAGGLLAFAPAAPAARAVSTTGDITGTVTNAGHIGIADIHVIAYQADGSGGWNWVNDAYTASDGSYDVNGLASGTYRVEFTDSSRAYATQDYNDKAGLGLADDVSVTAGATTAGINATLGAPGHITGTVTNASHAVLAGIDVSAYRADGSGGWTHVSGAYASTGNDGGYDLSGLAAGTYRVEFTDSSGAYLTQDYNNKATLGLADDVSVTAGSTTSGINATLALAGHITGTVTDTSHAGIVGVWVTAYRADGSGGWSMVGLGFTTSAGSYDVGGLATGTYRIEFRDYSIAFLTQYYDNKTAIASARDIAVSAGSTTAAIDATLAAAADSGWSAQSTSLPNDNLQAASFVDANHGWVVGYEDDSSKGVILATSDGGLTWSAQSPPAGAGGLGGVSFVDANHGWVVGSNEATSKGVILVTSDGGNTWRAQSAPAGVTGLSGVSFVDASHGWAVGGSGDLSPNTSTPVILATTDGGATWNVQSLPAGVSIGGLAAVGFRDASHGWAAGSSGKSVVTLTTSDGGATWSAKSAAVSTRTYDWLMAFDFVDASHGWAVGAQFVIVATSDGGATWNAQNAPDAGLQEQGVHFSDASHGWAVGTDGILATADGGTTWNLQRSPTGSAVLHGVTSIDATHAWAVGVADFGSDQEGGIIVRTTTGGLPPAPTLSGFTPSSGPVGTVVTVTGTHVNGATAVKFNGTPGSGFSVVGGTQLTVTVPLGATSGPISVTTPGGSVRSSTAFTVIPAPAIISFTPTSGPVDTSVTITGTGFTGTTAVKFNGTAASFLQTSDSQITAIVPSPATTGRISVTTSGGTATSTTSFTVTVPAPKLTRLSPTSAKRGATVTITGTNFGATRGTSTVSFGAVKATAYLSWGATRLTCKVPAKAKYGKLKVTVTTAAGTSNAVSFTVKR